MKLIKRYANRKLYDTEDKRYVSLSDIRDLIKKGVDLHVVDNETGEDITTVTLSQIIYEQEKKREGFLPPSVLMSLIQSGGTSLVDSVKKIVHTGVTAAHRVQDDVEKTLKRFLRTGELSEKEAEEIREKLESAPEGGEVDQKLEARVNEVLVRLDVVKKGDVERLHELVLQLEKKVDALLEGRRAEQVKS